MKSIAATIACIVLFHVGWKLAGLFFVYVAPLFSTGAPIDRLLHIGMLWLIAPGAVSYFLLISVPEAIGVKRPHSVAIAYGSVQITVGLLVGLIPFFITDVHWLEQVLWILATTSIAVGAFVAKQEMEDVYESAERLTAV